MIITDSTDPYGPAERLFNTDYYSLVKNSLDDEGLFVAQTESPFYDSEAVEHIYRNLAKVFDFVTMFWAPIPTYPGGGWSFCLASKNKNTLLGAPIAQLNGPAVSDLKYYNSSIHKGAFYLPTYMLKPVEKYLTWTA